MKIPVFFLSIFFLLQFGNVNSFAVTRVSFQCQSSSLNTNSKVFEGFHNTNQPIFITNLIQPEENKTLIFEELEDQDSFESSNKKLKIDNGLLSIFHEQFYFPCYANFVKPFPFLWRTTSQRYILQRALRI